MVIFLIVLAVIILCASIGCNLYGRNHIVPGFIAFFRKKSGRVLTGFVVLAFLYYALVLSIGSYDLSRIFGNSRLNSAYNPTISLDRAKETLAVGATTSFSASTRDVKGSVQWTSDAPEVATVAGDGVVTAHAVGMARVTAKADDASATAIITVVAAADNGQHSSMGNTDNAVLNPEPASSPDAVAVADAVLSLNSGTNETDIIASLMAGGKEETAAKAIVDAAKEVKANVDGMVDTGIITPEQAQDPVQLAQIADVFVKHGYTVAEFKALDLSGVMELTEYGQPFGAKDNFKGDITADSANVAVLVWGDKVTLNGNALGQSIILIYPQITASVEIEGGGYRPFATNPEMSLAHWQARLLADASIKMSGGTKYILNHNGLEQTDGLISEIDGTEWIEREDKPGEYLLPDENADKETIVKVDGTVHLNLNAAAICDATGQVIYEIKVANSVAGKDYYGEAVQTDPGAPEGWKIEYSRDGRILGVQGNGYLLIRDGKATYWQGFYDMIFNYAQ